MKVNRIEKDSRENERYKTKRGNKYISGLPEKKTPNNRTFILNVR